MKKTLEKILAFLAQAIVNKYKPKIVGITGSMGKTSAKEAVFAVLKTKFNARENIKNYNNEIGVPLTIIGAETGGKSPLGWLKVFGRALGLIFGQDKNYPEILVLEMGADKPGDIGYLTEHFPCDIGVVTKVGPAHLEAFKTVENIAKEKQKIVTHLGKEGIAILSYDDPLVREMHKRVKAKVVFFGQVEAANVRSIELIQQGRDMDLSGIKFKIAYQGSAVPVYLPGVVGAHQINSALIAAAVGLSLNMNLIEVSEGLRDYKTQKGRMNLIAGKNSTLIIDDTYNSSPRAAAAALDALADLNVGGAERKVVILGDMLELGDFTEQAHIDLGQKAAATGVKLLVCVGAFSDMIARGAIENGLHEIVKFVDSREAMKKVGELIKENDLILVKGSQGARMERVVFALMKEPEKARELLVRQDNEWKN